MKLLLIEDSKADARIIEILLSDIDDPIDITHTVTLGDALNALADEEFDCAMVDLGLPDGQGVENVQRIDSLAPNLPIIVMTGLDDEKTATAAISQGAQAYLVKGNFDEGQELKAVIDTAVASKKDTKNPGRAEEITERGFSNLARTASPDDTFGCDLEGNIDHWSEGAHKVYGFDTDQAKGMHISSLIPEDRPTEWSLIARRIETNESMHGFETVRLTQDGSRRLVELYINPRHDNENNIVGSTWITRDITQQKQAESAARQLAAIVESSKDAIIGSRLDTTILSWNKGAEELLGYTESEAVGQQIAFITKPDFRKTIPALVKRITSGKELDQFSTELLRKNGELFDASVRISPVRSEDGAIIGIAGIIRDVSDLKLAQEQLLQAEKMASLGGLVAGVAHEINTPVGVGVTAASHLRRKTQDFTNMVEAGSLKRSDLQKYLSTAGESSEIILSNLNRAAELIHSFKRVAVDQSSSEARQFKIKEYIEEILISLRPQLKRTSHTIEIDCDEAIEINSLPGAWSQILTNLVQNSLIHAYDEDDVGQITIAVTQNGRNLTMRYSDDGKGMTEEVAAKVFDPFYTTKRGQGGSGLGMNVVFNLATQKLAGEIEVKSKLGEGTQFIMTVPCGVET